MRWPEAPVRGKPASCDALRDDHGMPDDESRRVRTEPNDCRRDLLGLSHPADRLLRDAGLRPLNRSIIGVSTMPGHTAFTRIFDFA